MLFIVKMLICLFQCSCS